MRDFSTAAQEFGTAGIAIAPLPGIEHISAPEESGASFEENAVSKAVYYSSFTPELVVADDSGLEVDALDGAPGIYSARYAGIGATDAENNQLLLRNLAGITEREARFVAVVALAREGKIVLTAKGVVEGVISEETRGNSGFGYDPLFFYPPLNCAFGQITVEEKLAVSHRGRALRELFGKLANIVAA